MFRAVPSRVTCRAKPLAASETETRPPGVVGFTILGSTTDKKKLQFKQTSRGYCIFEESRGIDPRTRAQFTKIQNGDTRFSARHFLPNGQRPVSPLAGTKRAVGERWGVPVKAGRGEGGCALK